MDFTETYWASHLVTLTSWLRYCCGNSMGLGIRRLVRMPGSFQPPNYMTLGCCLNLYEPQHSSELP